MSLLFSEVHDSGKVTKSDSGDSRAKGDGMDRREAYAQNRLKDRGRHGGGQREKNGAREKGRTRDASLQMRCLEARRQFKQALAPFQP